MPVIVGGERTFLGSPRKVPKEGDIGEVLSVALPRAKAALSYVPLPARTWRPCSTLTGKTGKTPRRNVGGGSALPALPRKAKISFRSIYIAGKKSEHFLPAAHE